MSWNYRLFKLVENGEEYLEIREVYYDDKGEIMGFTETGTCPLGSNVDEIRGDLGMMLLALEKPVLVADQILVPEED